MSMNKTPADDIRKTCEEVSHLIRRLRIAIQEEPWHYDTSTAYKYAFASSRLNTAAHVFDEASISVAALFAEYEALRAKKKAQADGVE